MIYLYINLNSPDKSNYSKTQYILHNIENVSSKRDVVSNCVFLT